MSYEGNNLYRIYHSLTGKIHKTRDIDRDKGLLYNKADVKPCELADEEWEYLDDSFFADPLEFEDEEAETNARLALIALGEKSIKSLESGTRGNDVRSTDQEEAQPLDDTHNDTESALTLVSDFIDSSPRRSTRNHTKQVLYPDQIAYDFGPISKAKTKVPETS